MKRYVEDFMFDAEYSAIVATFPKWAARVEETVSLIKECSADAQTRMQHENFLLGLTTAMVLTRQCGRAYIFAEKAKERSVKNEN